MEAPSSSQRPQPSLSDLAQQLFSGQPPHVDLAASSAAGGSSTTEPIWVQAGLDQVGGIRKGGAHAARGIEGLLVLGESPLPISPLSTHEARSSFSMDALGSLVDGWSGSPLRASSVDSTGDSLTGHSRAEPPPHEPPRRQGPSETESPFSREGGNDRSGSRGGAGGTATGGTAGHTSSGPEVPGPWKGGGFVGKEGIVVAEDMDVEAMAPGTMEGGGAALVALVALVA